MYLDTNVFSGFDDAWKWNHGMVLSWSKHLSPDDGVMWDIGPGSLKYDGSLPETDNLDSFYEWENGGLIWYDENGNFGGQGHEVNPFTGAPYEVNMVPRGDYARVIAEFGQTVQTRDALQGTGTRS